MLFRSRRSYRPGRCGRPCARCRRRVSRTPGGRFLGRRRGCPSAGWASTGGLLGQRRVAGRKSNWSGSPQMRALVRNRRSAGNLVDLATLRSEWRTRPCFEVGYGSRGDVQSLTSGSFTCEVEDSSRLVVRKGRRATNRIFAIKRTDRATQGGACALFTAKSLRSK